MDKNTVKKLINHDQFGVCQIATLIRYSKSTDALELSTHAVGNTTHTKTTLLGLFYLELSTHEAKHHN